MDSCVIPLRHGGLSLVQTTDFFYPLVEDPYMMVSWSKHTWIPSHLAGDNLMPHMAAMVMAATHVLLSLKI